MSTFDEVKTRVSTMYVDLLKNIYKHIMDAGVEGEKHLSKYELNMNKFLETHDKSRIFKYFVQKYLHIMDEIVNRNIDFFLTQRPYILVGNKKKGKKTKRENSNATYLFPGNMLRYVLSSLKNPPKGKKVSRNEEISSIFDEFTQMFEMFYRADTVDEDDNVVEGVDFLDELSQYVCDNFAKSSRFNKYKIVLSNYRTIVDGTPDEVEEVSSEEEEESKDDGEGGGLFSGLPFGEDFIKNSTIGKLATGLSEELKGEFDEDDLEGLNNPMKVLGSMFGGGNSDGSGNKLQSTINKVMSKFGEKMNSGDINQEGLKNDVNKIVNSMGGLSSFLGKGGFGDIFKNM